MNCPRCGISTFAGKSNCPDCGWLLSRAHEGGNGSRLKAGPPGTLTRSAPTHTFSSAPPEGAFAEPLPAPGPSEYFQLSPPAQHPRARAHKRRPRWWERLNGSAVAVLPEEARWEGPPRLEIIELPVVQTAFDFNAADLAEQAERLAARESAPVAVRFQAGLLDATLVLLAAASFFGLFAALGGHLSLGRRDLLIYLAAAFVLSVLYFGLFSLLGGRTPGMQCYGLRVLTFEGQPPGPAQMLWRAFGYVVSLGSLALGFLWAVFDERSLTWHDHISQTFLTDREKM